MFELCNFCDYMTGDLNMSDGVCLRVKKIIGAFKCSVRINPLFSCAHKTTICTQTHPKIKRCFIYSTPEPISLNGQLTDSDGGRKLWTLGSCVASPKPMRCSFSHSQPSTSQRPRTRRPSVPSPSVCSMSS